MRIIRTPSSDLGRAAMQYARDGLRVLPCRPLGKTPAIPDWPNRATSDLGAVSRWWTDEPGFNVGILTGAPGPDVLDIDVRPGGSGKEFLEKLREDGLLDGAVRVVSTPSGGEHWWFPGTSRRKMRPAPYVDFQANGAYVLAPPSVIEIDGARRTYDTISDLTGTPAALAWEPVLARHRTEPIRRAARTRVRRAALSAPARWLAKAQPGERNDRLFQAACWTIRLGGDPLTLLSIANDLGLGPDEAEAAIKSAAAAEARRLAG